MWRSSIAAMLLMTWVKRMAAVLSSPFLIAAIASSRVVRVTDAKKARATMILYSDAFADYLEAVRVLVTESSMG